MKVKILKFEKKRRSISLKANRIAKKDKAKSGRLAWKQIKHYFYITGLIAHTIKENEGMRGFVD